MSDLSDLRGIFPNSLRWNAETGALGRAIYNAESGEREVQEILLGGAATFAMDLATRERGYGLIKVATYDMRLTSVGSPAPPWPGDDEDYKPAIGCWSWNPALGELRLETNAAIFRQAIADIWEQARFAKEAIAGLQPVIRFVDRVEIPIKSVGKTFYGPVAQTIGWTERNNVPGWSERPPTVAPPKPPPTLTSSSAPVPAVTHAKAADPVPTAAPSRSKLKPSRGAVKPGSDKPGPIDPLLNDDIPWK